MLPACRANDSIFKALIGSAIKSGNTRKVYEVNGYPYLVIKEDTNSGNVSNETEAKLYFTAVIKKFQNVLECIADIISISESGKYLIMEKLDTNIPNNLRPASNMPAEVSDNKLSNFGVTLNGKKVKCLDYAQLKNDEKPEEISGNVRQTGLPSAEAVKEMEKTIKIISG
ncbi:hypothetical protein BSF37_16755 [Serratia marcescens]|nr:hypothetical protein [Serratia marcescens]